MGVDLFLCTANNSSVDQHWKSWQAPTTKYLFKEANDSHIRMGLSLACKNMKEKLAIPQKSSRKTTRKQKYSVPLVLALLL